MLKQIWQKSYRYNVYIDIRDTNGASESRYYMTSYAMILMILPTLLHRIQLIRSHESAIMRD